MPDSNSFRILNSSLQGFMRVDKILHKPTIKSLAVGLFLFVSHPKLLYNKHI